LIPTSRELRRGERPKSIKGALTYPPISGVYFNTYIVDFESLYPSIIDVRNLSYETINCSHEECQKNIVPGLSHCVCKERRGIYSILIGSMKDLRIRWFKNLSKSKELNENERMLAQATSDFLKLILVSSYGVTIRIPGLACPPLAESITAYGRNSLQTSWNLAEEMGLHPIYGDTDSLFLDNPRQKEVELLIKEVKKQLQLDLAIDTVYSLCVLPKAMKAYFGIRIDGTPDLKGITAMKSNTPVFIQRVFENCIREMSYSRNFEDFRRSKERVQKIVREAVKKLVEGKILLDDLKYTVKLHEDPKLKMKENIIHQPYQCSTQLIDSGKVLRKGDSVSFIKVKPFIYRGKTFTVKPFEEFNNSIEYEINIEDYVRNLKTAMNQTFKILDLRFDQQDIDKSKNKVTLSDFI
jgi:DNA polymerase I